MDSKIYNTKIKKLSGTSYNEVYPQAISTTNKLHLKLGVDHMLGQDILIMRRCFLITSGIISGKRILRIGQGD